MAQHLLKTSCANGVISPLAGQRQDLELYKKSLAKLHNWFVLKHGGIRRRSGTRFRGAAKFANMATRLIAYTFSIGQSYVLEFGNLYMRVWVPTGLVAAGGGGPYEIATPYTASQVADIQIAPYNDTIYCSNQAAHPQLLTRILSNSWTMANCTFRDGPYMPTNATNFTVSVGAADLATNDDRTFTWSGGVDLTSADIGRHVRVFLGGKWSWGVITAITSPLVASVHIEAGRGGSGSTVSWRLGAFYVGNYPRCVSFFEDRLVWANTPAQPRGIFMSSSGAPTTYSPSDPDGTVVDSNGVSFELSRSDPILWLKESSLLQIGTASGVRSIGGVNGAAITARNVKTKLEVKVGCDGLVPEQAGPSTVLVGRTARRLNNLYYDYQVNGLVAPDMSILSEHLFKKRVIDVAYQETPDGILWTADTEGNLTSTTIEQSEDIRGFASHHVGGAVRSIAVMQTEASDQLWLCVDRTVNGEPVKYIETLEQPYDEDITAPEDAFIVDCGGTYTGAATGTVSGLTFLAGKTVNILADGARLPDTAVTVLGLLTLPNGRTASKIQIGLPIANQVATLEAPSLAPDGSTLGRRKKAFRVIVKALSSQGLRVGALGEKLQLLVYRNAAALMGRALPLNTGTFDEEVEDTFEGAAQIELQVDGPFPATILALNIDVESEP